MKRIQLMFVVVLMMVIVWSCEKDNVISNLCGLEEDEYYDSEIFDDDHLHIYGKWELFSACGTIAGTCFDILPESYLYIEKYGIYGFLIGDSLVNCGRLTAQDAIPNIIEFENFGDIQGRRYFNFSGKDTLRFSSASYTDGIDYIYKRVE